MERAASAIAVMEVAAQPSSGEEGGFSGVVTICASMPVDELGDSWSSNYTWAMTVLNGSVMLAMDPVITQGMRIAVETMDMTPEKTLEQ